jgi:glycosyltransferase involved in cell wall biosynthesis
MTLITPSRWLADLTRESFLREYPVEVCHNTIDETVFRPTDGAFRVQHGLEGKRLVLAVASAWGERKGLPDLIRLSEMLPENYTVVVVGLTPKQKESLPSPMVGITRTHNATELAHIYTTCDVFVNPTYEDTYPTVNLEAKACGTPVITYRTGGSVESVPEENVVEVGDFPALRDKILMLTGGSKDG